MYYIHVLARVYMHALVHNRKICIPDAHLPVMKRAALNKENNNALNKDNNALNKGNNNALNKEKDNNATFNKEKDKKEDLSNAA